MHRMPSRARCLAPLALSAALFACGTDPASTSGAAPSGSSSATTSSSAEKAGIQHPACITYLEKMRGCVAKAPETERDARTKSLDEIEKTWTEQSKTPDGRNRLVAACDAALKQFESTGACQ